MKIRFKSSYPKTIDGMNIGPFRAGEEREFGDGLASKFVASDMAEPVVDAPLVVPASGDEQASVDSVGVDQIEERPRRRRQAAGE